MKSKHLSFAALALCITLASCNKQDQLVNQNSPAAGAITRPEEETDNPDEILQEDKAPDERSLTGHVYTMSNDASQNMVLHYSQAWNGDLSFEGSEASGGTGAGMALGSQGALCLDEHHKWLFAVNAGDNTVSSFHIHADGHLSLAHTVGSGGAMPVSVTVKEHMVYVVNATSANICGFEFDNDGVMTMIPGSNEALSASNAAPAQIKFHPVKSKLYVTEKMTNMITVFQLDAEGSAGPAMPHHSEGATPFGFDFARDNALVVSEAHGGMANASTVSSYKGNLNTVSSTVPNGQTAACWVAPTQNGRYAFVTNTGSNTISTYYVNPTGHVYSILDVAAHTGMAPIDICVSGNNFFVYELNEMSHSIGQYKRGFFGTLHENGEVTGVPEHAAGLVAY